MFLIVLNCHRVYFLPDCNNPLVVPEYLSLILFIVVAYRVTIWQTERQA